MPTVQQSQRGFSMGKESLTKSTTKKKTTAKKKKADVSKSAATQKTAAPPVKPSLRDLLHQKFAAAPQSLYQPPAPATEGRDFSAPPFYATSDPQEAERVRALMSRKHSLADLETAAKAAQEARLKAEADAKAKAEEEARLKAEADARAKAEEEARLKAEADAKAKAEEEARLKAEAEKLAAERAAERQAAADSEPRVSVTYGKDSATASTPPVDKTGRWLLIGLAGGIAFLFLLIIGASLANTGKYYLKPTDSGIEIWQGKFAPIGTRHALSLPGVAAPATIAPVYEKSEVMPLAVDHFLARADAILAAPGIPDFQGVKQALETAMGYATHRSEKETIQTRLDGIDRAILIYKAQVGEARRSLAGYDEAIDNYRQALHLTEDEAGIQAIESRIAAVEAARVDLEARLAEEAAAAEAQPAD
jgi:chemotaxis protein histidine kinase CheA